MSRIAKNPVPIPKDVSVVIEGTSVTVKGNKGMLTTDFNPDIILVQEDQCLKVSIENSNKKLNALSGTTRALINNMVIGVSVGYQKKLILVGVGYRAQGKGQTLSLTLGFSHPIELQIPEGISVDTPSQTEIMINGCDKQIVGQVAANIRAYRPPEPYKGKGIRFSDEVINRKEAKKK